MNRRTRVLLAAALAAAGLFLADRGFSALWWDPWRKLSEEIRRADEEIARANAILERRASVLEGWRKIRDLLDKPRTPDVQTYFYSHLGSICDRIGVGVDVQGTGASGRQEGDFKEHVYDMKFRLTWAQFVDLLRELHNSKEFLKPLRISVQSHYEREDRLDVELKVSTIEYAPAPAKRG